MRKKPRMKKLSEPEALVIRGGLVYDGSGQAPYKADIAVCRGIIEEIGPCRDMQQAPVIDAQGLLAVPGFIDMHSHSDEHLLIDPRSPSKVFQGITTEVIGNCGFSPAPLYGENAVQYGEELGKTLGINASWTTCADFFALLEEKGLGINCIMLAGNGNIRGGVLGYRDRKAGSDDLQTMKAHLVEALGQGAWGLSSGLIYVPSCFADTDELVNLAGVCRDYGAIYATHMRGEGDSLLEALSESLEVSARSGVSLQISHLKASGEKNWHKLDRAIEMIEAARDRGRDIWCDVYPYTASSTGLDSFFPRWVRDGGRKAFVQRLKTPGIRERLGKEFAQRPLAWKDIVISSLTHEEGDIPVINFSQSEENVARVLKLPFSLICTDASAWSPEGPLSLSIPHPRAYGTCARLLGHYVRERKILALTRALDKITVLPARRLGLKGRGALQKGYHADITVFDPMQIAERSTYLAPHHFPAGIEHVLVNGTCVVTKGNHTGALPGRVLRRQNHKAG